MGTDAPDINTREVLFSSRPMINETLFQSRDRFYPKDISWKKEDYSTEIQNSLRE